MRTADGRTQRGLCARGEPSHPLLGTWVKIAAPEVVEILKIAGLDFVVIDMEHAPFSMGQVSRLLAVSRALDLPALVRVPALSESDIKRALDAGAAGVVVPHVDTVEQAGDVARFSRFPPMGQRGTGLTGRAGQWGLGNAHSYYADAKDAICVLVQLESEAALAAATQIGAVPGVDGLLIGPADLALSLGEQTGGPRSTELIAKAETECVMAGLPLATALAVPRSGELLNAYSMLVIGNDAQFLGTAAMAMLAAARRG